MKQTIEIEVPDGKKAVWKDNKVVFEDIKHDPPRFPKTWEEFCEFYPIPRGSACIDRDSNLLFRWDNRRCDLFDRNVLPSEKAAKSHRALMQLHQLRDCYRGDWIPTLKVSDDRYGIGYFYSNNTGRIELSVGRCCCSSMFLTFPTLKMASEFLTNFRELIEQAGDLI